MIFQVSINFGLLKRHPVQDWHTDNVADEDQRRVQIETERWGRELSRPVFQRLGMFKDVKGLKRVVWLKQ